MFLSFTGESNHKISNFINFPLFHNIGTFQLFQRRENKRCFTESVCRGSHALELFDDSESTGSTCASASPTLRPDEQHMQLQGISHEMLRHTHHAKCAMHWTLCSDSRSPSHLLWPCCCTQYTSHTRLFTCLHMYAWLKVSRTQKHLSSSHHNVSHPCCFFPWCFPLLSHLRLGTLLFSLHVRAFKIFVHNTLRDRSHVEMSVPLWPQMPLSQVMSLTCSRFLDDDDTNEIFTDRYFTQFLNDSDTQQPDPVEIEDEQPQEPIYSITASARKKS